LILEEKISNSDSNGHDGLVQISCMPDKPTKNATKSTLLVQTSSKFEDECKLVLNIDKFDGVEIS